MIGRIMIHCAILAYPAPGCGPDLRRGRRRIAQDMLATHLAWMRDHGFAPVTLDELCVALAGGEPLPEQAVVLSFDTDADGMLEHAAEALVRHGVPAIAYLRPAARQGALPFGATPRPPAARELAQAGIEIGQLIDPSTDRLHQPGNGQTHALAMSKSRLEEQAGCAVRHCASAAGNWDRTNARLLSELGFVSGVSNAVSPVSRQLEPYGLRRIEIEAGDDRVRLEWKLWKSRQDSLRCPPALRQPMIRPPVPQATPPVPPGTGTTERMQPELFQHDPREPALRLRAA